MHPLTHLREATPADRETLFRWRNIPELFAWSGSRRAVTADEHSHWFARVINSARHAVFLIEESINAADIGCVRLDRVDTRALISIYILPAYFGLGHGPRALSSAAVIAFSRWAKLSSIHAEMQPENSRSEAAFTRAGFIRCTPARRIGTVPDLIELFLTREAHIFKVGVEHFSAQQ